MPFPFMKTHNIHFQLAIHLLLSCCRSSHEANCFESYHLRPGISQQQENLGRDPLWMTGILLFEYHILLLHSLLIDMEAV